MKKLSLTSLLSIVFICNSFSFNFSFMKRDCNKLAIGVQDAYLAQGYSHADAYQHANWAYDGWVGNGGSEGDSVVVIE
jgi:hypothetical protein